MYGAYQGVEELSWTTDVIGDLFCNVKMSLWIVKSPFSFAISLTKWGTFERTNEWNNIVLSFLWIIIWIYIFNYYMQEPFVNIPEDVILCALEVLLGMSTSESWLDVYFFFLEMFLTEYSLCRCKKPSAPNSLQTRKGTCIFPLFSVPSQTLRWFLSLLTYASLSDVAPDWLSCGMS